MSDNDHDEFAVTDSGASSTYPKQCSAIRKNEHVMIKSRPCKVFFLSIFLLKAMMFMGNLRLILFDALFLFTEP